MDLTKSQRSNEQERRVTMLDRNYQRMSVSVVASLRNQRQALKTYRFEGFLVPQFILKYRSWKRQEESRSVKPAGLAAIVIGGR